MEKTKFLIVKTNYKKLTKNINCKKKKKQKEKRN